MKKHTKFFIVFLLSFLSVVGFISQSNAAEMRNIEAGEGIGIVSIDEKVEDDLYVVGEEEITINAKVDGDLFVAAGIVTVNEEISGDIYATAGKLDITSNVAGNIYVSGGQIDIEGEVQGNLFTAGGQINVSNKVHKDILMFGGDLSIEGEVVDDVRVFGGLVDISGLVNGDVITGGGRINLKGNVKGDVYAGGGEINIKSKEIGGDLVIYTNDQANVNLSDGTEIKGETEINEEKYVGSGVEIQIKPFMRELGLLGSLFSFTFKVLWTFIVTLGLILLGIILIKVAPVKVEMTLDLMRNSTELLRSFGTGVIAIPLGLILIVFLAVSIVGWPLLSVMTALLVVAQKITIPLVGLRLGEVVLELFNAKKNRIISITIGIFLIQILTLIPCFGSLVKFIAFLLAIGAMLRMKYEVFKKAKQLAKKK